MKNPIREALPNVPGHWFKGDVTDWNGNYCGVGHVMNMGGSHSNLMQAARIMDRVANELYPERAREWFANFNDHVDTTETEVLAVMQKAANVLDVEREAEQVIANAFSFTEEVDVLV